MARRKTSGELPEYVAWAIDIVVGDRQRAAFVAEHLRHELKRRQQLAALNSAAGTWKDADHPELADGGAVYVGCLRESDRQLEQDFPMPDPQLYPLP